MPTEERITGRGTIATVVATAAVTLAVGVTAAALGGYLTPARDRDQDQVTVSQATEPPAAETTAAPPTAVPNVVLVPVAPNGRAVPSTTVSGPSEPGVLVAAYDLVEYGHDDDDDHHQGRKHDKDHHDDDHHRGREHHEGHHDDD